MDDKTAIFSKKSLFSSFHATNNRSGTSRIFRELLEDWLDACTSRGLAQRTVYEYSDKVSRFAWWWLTHTKHGETLGAHPKFVTVKEAREFAAYLREPLKSRWGVEAEKEALSNFTIGTYGRSVKVFFNWLVREGYIEESPFRDSSVRFTRGGRKKDNVIKNIGTEKLARIFQALTEPKYLKTFAGVRDLAMFSLLLDSGIRKGELLSLTVEDLDIAKMRCTVRGKTGQRYAHFSEKCKGLLLNYLKFRREEFEGLEQGLWVTIDGKRLSENTFCSNVRRLEKKSGVDFHVHQLRHTFAMLMSSKVSIFELRDLLGHSSIKTTEIYVQRNPDRLGKIYRTNSPLTTLESELPGLKRRGRPLKTK